MRLAMIILPEKERHVPTSEELRKAGFLVSTAVARTPGATPGKPKADKEKDEKGTDGERDESR